MQPLLRKGLILVLFLGAVNLGLARKAGDPLKPGFNKYSKQQDIEMGKQAAAQVMQQYQQAQNPDLQAYLKRIGGRLATTPSASSSGFPFSFTVLNYKEVNAFALPGGPTFVFTGLIKAADGEEELAGVMAHEISHVVLRHSTNRMSKANIIEKPAIAIGVINLLTPLGRVVDVGLGVALDGIFLKNSREDESEADALGAHIMSEAGYDPIALARFFEKLEAQGGPGVPEFLSDHPSPGNRIEAVQAEMRTLPPRTYAKVDESDFQREKVAITKLPPPPDFRPKDIGVQAAGAGYKKLNTPQFSVEYPSNWQAQDDAESNLVAVAPKEGIVMSRKGEATIGLGAVVSYFFPDPNRASLSVATDDLVQRLRASDPASRSSGSQKSIEADKQPALLTPLSSSSPFGGTETDMVLTIARPEGLFYLIFISPEQKWDQTQPAFDHMIQSIHFAKSDSGSGGA